MLRSLLQAFPRGDMKRQKNAHFRQLLSASGRAVGGWSQTKALPHNIIYLLQEGSLRLHWCNVQVKSVKYFHRLMKPHVNEAFITLETRAHSLLLQPFPHPTSRFAVCGLQSSTSAEANMSFKCKIIRVMLKCLLWSLLGVSASV